MKSPNYSEGPLVLDHEEIETATAGAVEEIYFDGAYVISLSSDTAPGTIRPGKVTAGVGER